MKYLISLLIAIAAMSPTFAQKKDKFSIYDLDKKFHFVDSVNKQMNADSITVFVVKNYNFKSPHKAVHPKGDSYVVYEFHFTDNSNLYLLVKGDLIVEDITYKYNYTERGSSFLSWAIGSGKISAGKHSK
jgi:hypothetical protein